MRIHDMDGTANPLRVRIALAELGLTSQVEFVPVDLRSAEHMRPSFLAMNPEGTVPVLELADGSYISECTAITQFFSHWSGNHSLTGTDPKSIATIQMMQKRAERELLYACNNFYHFGTRLGPTAVARYKMPEWEGRQVFGDIERARAVRAMAYFDSLLADRPYVAGDHFSMADITLWAGLYFADIDGIPVSPELATLWAWRDDIDQRPSVQMQTRLV